MEENNNNNTNKQVTSKQQTLLIDDKKIRNFMRDIIVNKNQLHHQIQQDSIGVMNELLQSFVEALLCDSISNKIGDNENNQINDISISVPDLYKSMMNLDLGFLLPNRCLKESSGK
ncbi:hypothetical protein DLAC_06145 [Tieghemostelium lacteum]|uniref:Uncharacterized protein n=1 Tax=Tieghemostelium lacteum TaxID=361077 RepID=A0A151ZHL4_TIELA|nr:hypothetical protein DLAC_06145 [Tieghemostelium lacteum]|eukprot:KYQ93453.1 hypothetical protein DLAC_06145 [Tieghemostelium lacteum]